jgi:DedD protein
MMERALKERIIGAVVLVLVVVLVVPIFLDGPPDDGEIVSERVLLPGQEDQKTQTVVLDRDREDPVPAASSPVPARQEPAQEEPKPAVVQPAVETAPDKPAPEPVREPVVEQAAASTTGMWAVQLGSFSNKDNAEKLAADLRKQGYAAFLSQLNTDSGPLHRVRIGPQKDRESAEAMASRLLKVGHKGQVVPHP